MWFQLYCDAWRASSERKATAAVNVVAATAAVDPTINAFEYALCCCWVEVLKTDILLNLDCFMAEAPEKREPIADADVEAPAVVLIVATELKTWFENDITERDDDEVNIL